MVARTVYAVTDNRPVEELVSVLFDDLVRCETRLYNALDARLRERHGLVTSQFEFLRHLRDHPDTRVADLAATFAIGVGATSKGVDRLHGRGWVTRAPNTTDRRSFLLNLTASGTQLVEEAERTFTQRLHELTTPIGTTTAQLTPIAATLSLLRHALECDKVGTPTG